MRVSIIFFNYFAFNTLYLMWNVYGGINYIILFRHLFGSVYHYIIACSIIDLYLFFSDKINKTFVERARI